MSACFSQMTRFLRRIFVWMVLIGGLSSLVSYYIGLLLPWIETNSSVGFVNIKIRVLDVPIVRKENAEENKPKFQHQTRIFSPPSDVKQLNSKISYILDELKQVEEKIQNRTAHRSVLSLGFDRQETQILKEKFRKQRNAGSSHKGDNDYQDTLCSEEFEDKPLLSNLKIYPPINFGFYPYQNIYHITVDYDVIMLQFEAVSKGCLTETRFENISGLIRRSNYTIGLGDNVVKIHIVDMGSKQPVILNTYVVNVNRKYAGLSQRTTSVLKTCFLKQDCSLKFLPREKCGLQLHAHYKTWNKFIEESNKLPYCKHFQDYTNADWKIPCRSCDDRASCFWHQARWQPPHCHHKVHSFAETKTCLKGKKVLFIGDSTNRGILHYILEKVNGTLSDWDKTHDLKLYTNVNDQQTTMSFAYYPQFWLPNNHRPGFDKAIYQLIKWTSPLKNNSNTVLVVGGVQWLGKQHIDVIYNALKREGLTGIRLIMKGHGAGFHQHVEGVHYASLANQQKLELQEKEVCRYAANYGFHVVPTFKMTMSRYKDFLQGQCACHFHKVSIKTDAKGLKKYHIDGDVNAAYSELVINDICRQSPG